MKGRVIRALVLMMLLAGLPVVASADGAEIYKGPYVANGFLTWPLDCSEPGGHVIYFFFREGDPATGGEGDYLLDGIAIRTPEQAKASDIMSFKAEGSLASVWTVEQTTDFCSEYGEFDYIGFADYFRSSEGMWLWDVAEQDTVSFKWNFTLTDTLYKDSVVATGQKLTFRSLLWIRGEDGVITDMRDVTKLIWH